MNWRTAWWERRSLVVAPSTIAVAAAVAVLVWANVAANRLWPAWGMRFMYVPANLLAAVAVGVISWAALGATTAAVRREELGWTQWRRGATFGLVLATGTLALYLAALSMPAARAAFDDARVGSRGVDLLYHALVRIPLGTVVLEEIAFRSVLPALIAARWGLRRGILIASVLFGLWHVLPALGLNSSNEAVGDLVGSSGSATVWTVLLAVAATCLAGIWLCWLRYWSGSIVAPIMGHVATNSLGYLVAWIVAS